MNNLKYRYSEPLKEALKVKLFTKKHLAYAAKCFEEDVDEFLDTCLVTGNSPASVKLHHINMIVDKERPLLSIKNLLRPPSGYPVVRRLIIAQFK